MYKQLTIFDYMPTLRDEPDVGEWVEQHGVVIPHIMRRGYIGKKVLMDKSTMSHKWYKVGILEKVMEGYYYHDDQKVECDISIIFDGKSQRNKILHMPGQEIYECLPFDSYQKRNDNIGMRGRDHG